MIIAEFSNNWNGDKFLLKEMVEASANAGAHFAKVQTFFSKDLSHAQQWRKTKDRVKSLELNSEDHKNFVSWCESCKIEPLTTLYSDEYIGLVIEAGFKYVKIGSPQANKGELITRCMAEGLNVILSTGGHLLYELPKINPYAVLHCVSLYPTQPFQANLTRMWKLKEKYPNSLIGFSDHSTQDATHDLAKIAITLGADLIEAHVTMLPCGATKDGPVSKDFKWLKNLCDYEKMSVKDRFLDYPFIGLLEHPQSQDEQVLINEYKGRWIK